MKISAILLISSMALSTSNVIAGDNAEERQLAIDPSNIRTITFSFLPRGLRIDAPTNSDEILKIGCVFEATSRFKKFDIPVSAINSNTRTTHLQNRKYYLRNMFFVTFNDGGALRIELDDQAKENGEIFGALLSNGDVKKTSIASTRNMVTQLMTWAKNNAEQKTFHHYCSQPKTTMP